MDRLNWTDTGASSEAIRAHYDLSDEFFALFLDPEMVYSCAIWETDDSLETAQIRKLEYHMSEILVSRCRRVLDIGCGWGALLRRLIGKGTEKAIGLTLSEAQAKRITANALPGMEVHLESWRMHKATEPYDAVICIGALEHFVRQGLTHDAKVRAYRDFFEFCHTVLGPNGRLSLQTIVYSYDAGTVDPFISTAIFPESDLPYLWEILKAADGLFDTIKTATTEMIM